MICDARLAGLAMKQDGVFTRHQLLTLGFTNATINARLCRGVWRLLHPDVYVAASTPLTGRLRSRAALLWLGPPAVLSHLSAAAEWHLDLPPSPWVWATIPAPMRVPTRAGLVVTRSRHVRGRRCWQSGLPVSPPDRTIVDLAHVLRARADRALD